MGCINPFTTVCRWFGGCRPEAPEPPPSPETGGPPFQRVDQQSNPGWDWPEVLSTIDGTRRGIVVHPREPEGTFEFAKADLNGDGVDDLIVLENNYAYDLRDPNKPAVGVYDFLSVVDGRTGRRFKVNMIFTPGSPTQLGRRMNTITVTPIDNDDRPDIAISELNPATRKLETVVFLNKMPKPDDPKGTPTDQIVADVRHEIVGLKPDHNKSRRIRNIVFTGTNVEAEGVTPLTPAQFKRWAQLIADTEGAGIVVGGNRVYNGIFGVAPYLGRADDFNLWFVPQPATEPSRHRLAAFTTTAYQRNDAAYEKFFKPAEADPHFAGQTVYWVNLINGDCRSQGIAVALSGELQDPQNLSADGKGVSPRLRKVLFDALGESLLATIQAGVADEIKELAEGDIAGALNRVLEKNADRALRNALLALVHPTRNRKAFVCLEPGGGSVDDPVLGKFNPRGIVVAKHEVGHLDFQNDEYTEASLADMPHMEEVVAFMVAGQTIDLTPLKDKLPDWLANRLPNAITTKPPRHLVSPETWQAVLGKPDLLFPNSAPDAATAQAWWGPLAGMQLGPYGVTATGTPGSFYFPDLFFRPSAESMMHNSDGPNIQPNAVQKAVTRGLWILPYLN